MNARTVHCPKHARHVGVCPACQRARLAAEEQQLAEVRAITVAAGSEGRAQLVTRAVAGGSGGNRRWGTSASR